jgi:hypothetical protein
MARPFDIRQSIYRYALNQLVPSVNSGADKILESINSDLSPHFRIMANGTLTVAIEAAKLQNPQTTVNRSFAPVGGYIEPTFVSGSITLPAASGGNIIVTPGSNVPLTLTDGYLCKVLIYVKSTGDLAVKVGRQALTVSAAITPSLPNNCYSCGYIIVRNVAGITPVAPADVYRFTGQSFSSARNNSGFVSWAGGPPYLSRSGGAYTLQAAGNGFVQGTFVPWVAGQSTGVLPANQTSYLYVDSNGTFGSTTTPSFALYRDNIVIAEILYDGTSYTEVKETHPYDMELEASRFLHDNVGTVISGTGANVAKVTTGTGLLGTDREIKIVGGAWLEDHGLRTEIVDTTGFGASWTFWYLNSSSKWIRYINQSEMPMEWNNSGTLTALTDEPTAASVAIVTLYAAKSPLDSSSSQLFAVIDGAVYDTVNDAKNAITNGTFQGATNELANLELAKLGHAVIVGHADGGYVAEAIISKDTLRGGSGGGAPSVLGDHSALNNLLLDTHTQYALLAGRSTGQVLYGGQDAGDDLTLRSTPNATKGSILIDEATNSAAPNQGALIVTGGVGIGSNLHVGQDIIVATGQKVDTTAAGTLNIGSGNADVVNIGRAGATVNVFGSLVWVQTTNVEITDKLVVLNKNGGASPDSSGFHVERTGGNISLLTDTALASKWKIGYSGSESEILTAGTAQTITGEKTFSFGRINLTGTAGENEILAFGDDAAATPAALTYTSKKVAGSLVTQRLFQWNNDTDSVGYVNPDGSWVIGSSTASAATVFAGTAGIQIPNGTTLERPGTPLNGIFRFNTDLDFPEFYSSTIVDWEGVASRRYALAMAIVMS